jgi:integrase
MKGRREHRVPLAPAVRDILAVLKQLPRSTYLFAASKFRPIASNSMWAALRRMGRSDLTVHGFRSTFSDWCAEETIFPSDLREMALAHQVGSQVEQAYRRGDMVQRRVDLMECWAAYCTGAPMKAWEQYLVKKRPGQEEPPDNVVVPLRRAP